ncbi:tetratricopeptide repeat protein [Flavobacterium faecale]|nr:tetratricopeptide repeat protein [Flavobacterium faecale]
MQFVLGQKAETDTYVVDTLQIDTYLKKASSLPIEQKAEAVKLFNKASFIAIDRKLEEQVAKVYFKGGMFFYERYDNFEAIKYFNKALPIYENLQMPKALSEINFYLGESYLSVGSDDVAFKYYIRALRLFEDSGNKLRMADCYNGIGTIYGNKNPRVAIKYIKKTFPIFMEAKNYNGIAISYINMANTIANQGKFEQAIVFYSKSLTAVKKTNNRYNLAINYNNIGDCYNNLKQYNKAISYFNHSLALAKGLKSDDFNSLIKYNIAEAKLNLGLYDEAIDYVSSSLELTKTTHNIEIETSSLLLASKAYEKMGKQSLALQFKNDYIDIKQRTLKDTEKKKIQLFQSVLELEKSQFQVSELEVKNENNQLKLQSKRDITYFLVFLLLALVVFVVVLKFQQKAKREFNRQLILKSKEISEMKDRIQIQNDYLSDLNTTKNKLFKIIAHDLKNPLSSIEGFTDLMIHDDGDYDEEESKMYLKVIQESATKASVILNDVLQWAVNQENPVKNKKVDLFKVVTEELKLLEIQALQKEIILENKIDPSLKFITDKNKLATIIRNLISNAIKFTPEKGTVTAISELIDKKICITIRDTGIGMAPNILEKIFVVDYRKSRPGTNSEGGTGLGLILCKDFVEKLGGTITVNSEVGVGSSFSFTLPYCTEECMDQPEIAVEELV